MRLSSTPMLMSAPRSKASLPRPSVFRGKNAPRARAPSWTSGFTMRFSSNCKARVEKLTVGDPAENANLGAVINQGSMKSILSYIEYGKKDGRLITGGGRASGEGYFVQPTVIADIQPKSKLEAGGNFRPGAGCNQVTELRPRAGNRQRHRVRAHRSGVHELSGQDRTCHPRFSRRQSVHQSQMHRRHGGGAPLWRIQHVGHGFKSRRAGLPLSFHPSQSSRRKNRLTLQLSSTRKPGWVQSSPEEETGARSPTSLPDLA